MLPLLALNETVMGEEDCLSAPSAALFAFRTVRDLDLEPPL